jgi:dGTPase
MERWSERKRKTDEPGYQPKTFNVVGDEGEYQRDRARVIHSAAFRRLQSKTQVLGIGESDFYRTRLTHSLEVAQIATSILQNLHGKLEQESRTWKEYLPNPALLETIGLLHDLGHPPFGHGGEVALNHMMRDHGGFEGNGQTLRIMSRLGEYSPSHGLDLTRRAMLGALKYPCLYSEVAASISANAKVGSFKPPKCIYDDESSVRDWIFSPFNEQDRKKFVESCNRDEGQTKKNREPLYKSFDTSILELADDTAYGVHDFEDALALQLINEKKWTNEVAPKIFEIANGEIEGKDMAFYNQKLFAESGKERKHAISKLVGFFVTNVIVIENENFSHPLLRFNVNLPEAKKQILKLLKDFVRNEVIFRPQVQALEFKGQRMILELFEVLRDHPKRLLPRNTYETYEQCTTEQERMRAISDYIAGMTDPYATKLYHRLFSPDIGSIYDRI